MYALIILHFLLLHLHREDKFTQFKSRNDIAGRVLCRKAFESGFFPRNQGSMAPLSGYSLDLGPRSSRSHMLGHWTRRK